MASSSQSTRADSMNSEEQLSATTSRSRGGRNRRHASQACIQCAGKRRRCDGRGEPGPCGPCSNRGMSQECKFGNDRRRRKDPGPRENEDLQHISSIAWRLMIHSIAQDRLLVQHNSVLRLDGLHTIWSELFALVNSLGLSQLPASAQTAGFDAQSFPAASSRQGQRATNARWPRMSHQPNEAGISDQSRPFSNSSRTAGGGDETQAVPRVQAATSSGLPSGTSTQDSAPQSSPGHSPIAATSPVSVLSYQPARHLHSSSGPRRTFGVGNPQAELAAPYYQPQPIHPMPSSVIPFTSWPDISQSVGNRVATYSAPPAMQSDVAFAPTLPTVTLEHPAVVLQQMSPHIAPQFQKIDSSQAIQPPFELAQSVLSTGRAWKDVNDGNYHPVNSIRQQDQHSSDSFYPLFSL